MTSSHRASSALRLQQHMRDAEKTPLPESEGVFDPFCTIPANLPGPGRCMRKSSDRRSCESSYGDTRHGLAQQHGCFPAGVSALWARMCGPASADRCSLSSWRRKLLPKYWAVMCSSCALYPVLPSALRLPSELLCAHLGGIMHTRRGHSFPRALDRDRWLLYSRADLCRCVGRAQVTWTSLCLLLGLAEPSGRGVHSPGSNTVWILVGKEALAREIQHTGPSSALLPMQL